MTGTKAKTGKKSVTASPVPSRKKTSVRPYLGLGFFVAVLLGLSLLGGFNFQQTVRFYVAGEIARQDVTADQDLLIEDRASTLAKREDVASMQPTVFDLSYDPIQELSSRVKDIFDMINTADLLDAVNTADPEQLRWQVAELLNTEISPATYEFFGQQPFQQMVLNELLPWIALKLERGIASDTRLVSQYRNGIIIRNLNTDTEALRTDMTGIMDIRSLRLDLARHLKDELDQNLRTRKAVTTLIGPLITPSLVLNREETRQRRQQAIEAVDPVYFSIKKGEIIVRQGERVTLADQLKLQALMARQSSPFFPTRTAGLFITALLLGGGLAFSKPGKRISHLKNKDLLFTGLLILLFAGGAKALMLLESALGSQFSLLPLLYPVPGALGVVAMIFGLRRCSVMALMVSFLCTALTNNGIDLFLFYFLSSMWNVLLIKRAQSRSDIAFSVFPLVAGMLAAWFGTSMFMRMDTTTIWTGTFFVVAGGVLSMLVVFALSPIIEMSFRYTTRFRLMELMNLESPILQELMVNAPGTYHHSLIVSNMVEAGAKAIGANSLLCKVAALYHDMGKLHKSEYFIENQGRRKNPHDKLSPSMSTLIITSHVKKGAEMAKKERLGPEITEIIQQHHGTSLVRYFFAKAQENGENPRQEDYQYSGPKPQTKEAAIVMLADAVEASSRVLADPTPSRIKGHISTIIKGIFAEGQLDESELTFKDLHKLGESFHRILTGIFHRRIEYPESNKESGPKDSGPKENGPKENGKEKTKNGADSKQNSSKTERARQEETEGSIANAAPTGEAVPASSDSPTSKKMTEASLKPEYSEALSVPDAVTGGIGRGASGLSTRLHADEEPDAISTDENLPEDSSITRAKDSA